MLKHEHSNEIFAKNLEQLSESMRSSFNHFLEGISDEGFRLEYLKDTKFWICYGQYAICILEFTFHHDEIRVVLNRRSKVPEGKTSIQKKKFFQGYWTYNILKKEFSTHHKSDIFESIIEIFKQIKSVFFEDIVVDFRISKLKFENYRGFKDEDFTFNSNINVLIGKNGTGKTSILDGISVIITSFLASLDETTDSRTITQNDVRVVKKEEAGTMTTNHRTPTAVQATSEFFNQTMSWLRERSEYKKRGIKTKPKSAITNMVRQIEEDIRNEDSTRRIVLPVFSYHGTGRVANFTRDMKLLEKTERISRFFGYRDCLKPASNYKTFLAWYRKIKFESFEMDKEIPSLEAVDKAIIKGLRQLTKDEEKQVKNIRYLEGQIHILYSNDELVPIDNLSDGYQDVIGIISDIAYRMAVLNPHLGKDILDLTPGVVLIDEVELHLHMQWQQKIVDILRTIFPKVQFVITTHSPMIVSTTRENEAIELIRQDHSIVPKPMGKPSQWYFSDILAQAFHISKQPLYLGDPPDDLDEKLKYFNDMVKDYLANPEESLKINIHEMYDELLPSLPEGSAKRQAIDSLKGLVR